MIKLEGGNLERGLGREGRDSREDPEGHVLSEEEIERIIERYSKRFKELEKHTSKVQDALEELERDETSENLDKPKIVDSKQNLEHALEHYPELRLLRRFDGQLQEVGSYFEGDMEREMPSLVREVEQKEKRRIYEQVHGGPPEVEIESMDDVDRLLEKYPQEREEENFPDRYRHVEIYLEIRKDETRSQRELAEIHDVSQGRISKIQAGIEPTLVAHLRSHEEDRTIDKWCHAELNEELLERTARTTRTSECFSIEDSREHTDYAIDPIRRIESSEVGDAFKELNLESCSIEDLGSIVKKMCHELVETDARIVYLDLSELDTERVGRLTDILQENREEIEESAREQLGLKRTDRSVRIGIVDERVYTWNPDMTPNDMLNAWSDQYFYFNRSDHARLVIEVREKLQLEGSDYDRMQHLNELIRQVVSSDSTNQIRPRIKKSESARMMGDVLHLSCDMLGVSPRSLEDEIEKVTGKNGHGGILNPRLLRGDELEILRARLGAAVNSDCWLGEDGRLQYQESSLDRIGIVEHQFQQLGDISFELVQNDANESLRAWLPRPMGNAFIYWGFTFGDKPMQNERLSELIREGSLESGIAYLEDLISEEGSFEPYAGFRWSRTIVLVAGSNDTKYRLEPKFNQDEIEFLKGMEDVRRDTDRGHIFIPISKIAQLESDIAEKISSVVERNRSKLIDDEAALAQRVGIGMHIYPEYITIYEETGRISLKWVAKAKGKDDAIRWGLLAPPNDPRKCKKVQKWLAERPDEVERIRAQLQKEGLM